MPLTELEIEMYSNKITEIDIKLYGTKIIFGNELVKKYSQVGKKDNSDIINYWKTFESKKYNNIF